MAKIEWSEEDQADAYPAVLETLRQVFEWADNAGSMGQGAEEGVIGEMWARCEEVLQRSDPASIPLLSGQPGQVAPR